FSIVFFPVVSFTSLYRTPQAASRRAKLFREAKVPLLANLINARVSSIRPLRVDDYGIVCIDGELFISKVVALYEKTAGKNGKHASITESSEICAISYLDLQLFERLAHGNQFTSITGSTVLFRTKHFTKIP
ncbi:hypothetical protein BDP27DRAFT_1266639, partial [Rhodocollybia butyracea]